MVGCTIVRKEKFLLRKNTGNEDQTTGKAITYSSTGSNKSLDVKFLNKRRRKNKEEERGVEKNFANY